MLRLNVVLSGGDHQNATHLELSAATPVDTLRGLVAHRHGVLNDPAVVRLLYMGRLLQNGRTLESYALRDGAAVHAVIRQGTAGSGGGGGYQQQQQPQPETAGTDWGGILSGFMSNMAAARSERTAAGSGGGTSSEGSSTSGGGGGMDPAVAAMLSGLVSRAMERPDVSANLASARASTTVPGLGSGSNGSGGGGGGLASLLSNPVVSQLISGALQSAVAANTVAPAPPPAAPAAPVAAQTQNTPLGQYQQQHFQPPRQQKQQPPLPAPSAPTPAYTPPSSTVAAARSTEPPTNTAPQSGSGGGSGVGGSTLFLEHLVDECRGAPDLMGVGMGYAMMGNTASLVALRPRFAAAEKAHAWESASLMVPTDGNNFNANGRAVSLAGSEGDRMYQSMLANPKTGEFLRSVGVTPGSGGMDVINAEVRNLLKNALLSVMRLSREPIARTSDAEWAAHLNRSIVYTVGLSMESGPRWFPNGGSDAAVQFITSVLLEELMTPSGNNNSSSSSGCGGGQPPPPPSPMAAMLPVLATQLAARLHREYLALRSSSGGDGGDDGREMLQRYPTAEAERYVEGDNNGGNNGPEPGDAAVSSDPRRGGDGHGDDNEEEASSWTEVGRTGGNTNATAGGIAGGPSAGLDSSIERSMAAWTATAGVRPSLAETLAALTAAATRYQHIVRGDEE